MSNEQILGCLVSINLYGIMLCGTDYRGVFKAIVLKSLGCTVGDYTDSLYRVYEMPL